MSVRESFFSYARAAKVRAPLWAKRHSRLLTVLAALLLVYACVGFFLVPRLARDAVERFVRDDLDRQISIGALTFNPFTFTARASRVALSEQNGEPIVSVSGLLLNLELSSLVHRALTFKEVRIEKPQVQLVIASDGSVNLAQLAPRKAEPEKSASPSPLPHVRIGAFAVHGGSLKFEDRTREEPFSTTLFPIEFALSDFRTEPEYENAYHFSASTPQQERFDWSGEFTLQPVGSSGRFAVERLQAATITPYLEKALPFELRSGRLDVGGSYTLRLEGSIDLRFTIPALSLQELALAPKNENAPEPWIHVPAAKVAGVSFASMDRAISIEDISVNGAKITAWRELDGRVNLQRLFGQSSAQAQLPSAEAKAPTAAPWRLKINNVAVKDASLAAEDRSVMPAVHIDAAPIDVTLHDFSTEANDVMKLDSTVGFGANAQLRSSGELRLQPLTADLQLELSDFDLTPLQPYVAAKSDVSLISGRVSANTKLNYLAAPAAKQPSLKLSGEMQVNELRTQDKALKEDFIKWRALQASGIELTWAPNALTIQRVHAVEPYGRVIVASNRTLNLRELLKPENKQPTDSRSSASSPAGASLPIDIRNIAIEGGSANFADYSIEPSFATGIQHLQGSIRGVSSNPKSRAQIKLAGSVDPYTPVTIGGEANFLAARAFSDVAMDFRNMDLTVFNPYSGKYAGYDIAKGKLSTLLNYKIRDGEVEAQHHLVIDQLEFGRATGSQEAVSIPVKLAASLLKNRDGIIELDLPLSGNLKDPEFKLGPIIGRALFNVVSKVVTSPFSLLGSLFGDGGSEELAYVNFAPGAAELAAAENDKLGKLARALNQRPQLKLDVPADASAAEDAEAVARLALERALAPELKKSPSNADAAQKQRLAALEALYQKEFKQTPASTSANASADELAASLEKTLLSRYTPTPEQLSALAHQRADSVRSAIVSQDQIDPERIYFTTENTPAKTQDGQVRLELKLE